MLRHPILLVLLAIIISLVSLLVGCECSVDVEANEIKWHSLG